MKWVPNALFVTPELVMVHFGVVGAVSGFIPNVVAPHLRSVIL